MRFTKAVNRACSLFALQQEETHMDLSDLQYVHYMVSKQAVTSMNKAEKKKSIARQRLHLMKLVGSASGGCLFVK